MGAGTEQAGPGRTAAPERQDQPEAQVPAQAGAPARRPAPPPGGVPPQARRMPPGTAPQAGAPASPARHGAPRASQRTAYEQAAAQVSRSPAPRRRFRIRPLMLLLGLALAVLAALLAALAHPVHTVPGPGHPAGPAGALFGPPRGWQGPHQTWTVRGHAAPGR